MIFEGKVAVITGGAHGIGRAIDAWQEKKESQEAQAGYNSWLNSDARWQDEE